MPKYVRLPTEYPDWLGMVRRCEDCTRTDGIQVHIPCGGAYCWEHRASHEQRGCYPLQGKP